MVKIWFSSVLAALILLISSSTVSAKTDFFKIEDLQPGMKGIGKTCYQGTKPEEFQVEILGVLHGVNPGANAVLARFSGGLIDKTGVFEGMSGSPVFIDGKLLGAVAFTYPFAKEAIGGITPITQMIDAFDETPSSPAGSRIIFKKSELLSPSIKQDILKNRELHFINAAPQNLMEIFGGRALIPIATPLSFGGLAPETLKIFAPRFRAFGMSTLQGTGKVAPDTSLNTQAPEYSPFEPGSNIVVPLVRGDLDMSVGGTVTYIDDNRLYAFGHNMFQLGFTDLPMHKGRSVTIFPSLDTSFKILETGELAGSIRQDRGMGIYGILGEKPKMVPLNIHLNTSRGGKKEFRYELACDRLLTPLLVNLTVYNTIIISERAQGFVTLRIKGKINIKDEQSVELDYLFSSDSDVPNAAALSIAVPVNYLMAGGYHNLDLQDIDLELTAQESDQSALLDSIRFSRTEVKAGENLQLEIAYKKTNGDRIQETYPVQIPENASPGALTLLVSDGATLMTLDEEEEGENVIPRDLTQLIKLINNLRKNDRLYLRFYRQESGVLVKGEGLPGLPPSILSILKSDRKVGAMTPIHSSTLMEYELPRSGYMVAGAKLLKLVVKP
jgi:hypothetical protein